MTIYIKQYLEACEEVTALENGGSITRSDIIVLNRQRNSGLRIDPTIGFENCDQQTKLVNEENQNI